MYEKKKTRLFARILTTVALTGLLTTTAFAGSPKATFYFDFPWGSDTQYSEPAKKSDAGTSGGSHADVAVTQDTKITYTVVKKSGNKDVSYSKSGVLYSEDYRQTLSLDYTKYVKNGNDYILRGESDWGRYGTTTDGTWWP